MNNKIKTDRLIKGIIKAIEKVELSLMDKVVLTEAATGNYVVTQMRSVILGEFIKVVLTRKPGKIKFITGGGLK